MDWLYLGIAVWWSLAVVFFAFLTSERRPTKEAVTNSVAWPLVLCLTLPVTLWRIPFKSAKAIRADLRNRKLLKDFDKWLQSQPKQKT